MAPLAIGIDIGGTKIAAGVVDDGGHVLRSTLRETPAQDPAELEEAVADAIRDLQASHAARTIGIAAAGFVDKEGETVIFAPNLAWRDRPLAQNVGRLVDGHVSVDNDANAAGWAEFKFGAGTGTRDMIMLTVGTGLGGAIIANRRLARGEFGLGGELGHLRVVPDGRECGCGNRGCWEQYTSGRALVREARALAHVGSAEIQPLLDRAGGDAEQVEGPMVTELAQAGDPGSTRLLATIGHWLGEGAASVAALLDPGRIVVGGGLSAAGELVLGPMRESYAAQLTIRDHRKVVDIVVAQMGNEAGMVGAADLARKKFTSLEYR